jgi:hypothetical protein
MQLDLDDIERRARERVQVLADHDAEAFRDAWTNLELVARVRELEAEVTALGYEVMEAEDFYS